jgi:Fic family protein
VSDIQIQHIWPREGIHDLPQNWSQLAVASLRDIERQWRERLDQLKGSPVLERFTQELHREWAIETGQIENLYDIERGVTMNLIRQGFDASLMSHGLVNKPPEYILALLNDQKNALEGLFDFVTQRRPLSVGYIKELHAAMCRSQATVTTMDQHGFRVELPLLKGQWKQQPNFPRRNGTAFEYCPPEHTAAEMDRLVAMHLEHTDVASEVEAAWLHHRFTQIHPFQDGNGRVARALASLVLVRASLFPMVVPRDEKDLYIEALERADSDNLQSLVNIIARGQQNRFTKAMSLSTSS